VTNVHLVLSDEEASSLRDLLDGALREMSMEIADTDNPEFRKGLRNTRECLRRVRSALD
jgi:hypothetical protein